MEFLIIFACYILGSFPSAVLICYLRYGTNPRELGSGNPGATNVARLYGIGAGITVFLLDFGKGVAAIALAHLSIAEIDLQWSNWIVPSALIAVSVGHAWPIFTKFKGGKCVATAMGALALVNVYFFSTLVGTWLLVFALLRISALAAVVAYATILLAALYGLSYLWFNQDLGNHWLNFSAIASVAILVLIRHKPNYPEIGTQLRERFGKNDEND